MRSTFKTVFYVNGSKEKNGIVPKVAWLFQLLLFF